MQRKHWFALVLLVLLFACEKQIPEPAPTLSEYIIGDWEEREYMDISVFQNREFNSLGPPYGVFYRFNEDQTFVLWFGGIPETPYPFSVNEIDSTLTLKSFTWDLIEFNESFIEIQTQSGSGPVGKRLYKVE